MIKTVIFDIGNVLVNFHWREMFVEKGLKGEIFDRVANATILSPVWCEIDRGIMTYEEVMDAFVNQDKEMESEIRRALENTHDIVTKRDFAIPWICSLKERGLQVLVLSNFGKKLSDDCPDAMEFLSYTDGGILSYKDHLLKPEPEIYQLLLGRYGLKAQECVFIDDLQENIDAAKEQGIHGIVFHNYEQAAAELNRMIEN